MAPAVFLVWEDLTATVRNTRGGSRKLLQGISGCALPGRLLAIMGPSGSGKSTLLDSLAGRLGRNVGLSGTLLLNGQKRRTDYGVAAYVRQENVLLGTLTVRETITYSAHLRLPSSMTKKEVIRVVEATIEEMGLEDCSDRVVGNWHRRGISGGQKKRLCIALEILTKPPLLFLDEPTSGLDSAASFFIIQMLRQMTRDGNKTVISSIHQPSSETFALFDDLFLLSGGQVVYFGDAKLATKFFAEAGLPCPIKRSPADHFLRCINSDFDRVNAALKGSIKHLSEPESSSDPLLRLGTAEIKAMLIDTFKSSEYAILTETKISELSKIEGLTVEFHTGSQASWWKQLKTLTHRSFTNMYRDIGYYWLRLIIFTLISLCMGTIYFNVGNSHNAIWARASSDEFISSFMTFMSIGGFPSFVEEIVFFYHERQNGHYGVAVYTISNFLSSFPFLVTISTVTTSITYFMLKAHRDFAHYAYFAISIYTGVSAVESIMMVVASLVPNFLMGIISGAGIMGILMMTAGFFRPIRDLPKPVWRYPITYINYYSWLLQGFYKNDFIGSSFNPMVAGDSNVDGEFVLEDTFGVTLRHSKWVDLLVAALILITYRILFFLILKLKEVVSPLFRKAAVDTKAL